MAKKNFQNTEKQVAGKSGYKFLFILGGGLAIVLTAIWVIYILFTPADCVGDECGPALAVAMLTCFVGPLSLGLILLAVIMRWRAMRISKVTSGKANEKPYTLATLGEDVVETIDRQDDSNKQ